MLNLTNVAGTAPDSIQIITSSTSAIDVHASWLDMSGTTVTPGRANSAIVTATTTVNVVPAPGSGVVRNVKTLHIRNKGAASNDITVVFDQNATDYELHKVTLDPGETLEYIEGVGFFTIEAAFVSGVSSNLLTGGDQTLSTADIYLSNSAIPLAGLGTPTIGRCYHWRMILSKSAGTAAPVLTVRVGTAGAVADTARLTFTWGIGTSVADRCEIELEALVIAAGASAVLRGKANMTNNLSNTLTGFSGTTSIKALNPADSGTFDSTVAGSIIGLSWNGGTAFAGLLEYMGAFTDKF